MVSYMQKNYEKKELLMIMIIIFILIELSIVATFFTKNYRQFETITAIVITDGYVKTYINSSTLDKLNKSNYFYLDDKKYNYKIINIEKNVLKQNKVSYHEVLIKFKFPKKYKDNDSLVISIYSQKEKIYKIFKKCWESDL